MTDNTVTLREIARKLDDARSHVAVASDLLAGADELARDAGIRDRGAAGIARALEDAGSLDFGIALALRAVRGEDAR